MQGFDYLAWSVVGLQVMPSQEHHPSSIAALSMTTFNEQHWWLCWGRYFWV